MDGPGYMSAEVCNERNKRIDERFDRDLDRLGKLETTQDDLKEVSIQLSEMIKRHDEQVKNHEDRLSLLEKKPSVWFDRIIGAIIGAVGGGIGGAIIALFIR